MTVDLGYGFALSGHREGHVLSLTVEGELTLAASSAIHALVEQEVARQPVAAVVINMLLAEHRMSSADWEKVEQGSAASPAVPVVFVVRADQREVHLQHCRSMERYGLLRLTTWSLSAALRWAELQACLLFGPRPPLPHRPARRAGPGGLHAS